MSGDPAAPAPAGLDRAALRAEIYAALAPEAAAEHPAGLGEEPRTFAGEWRPRFAAALREAHPRDTCKLVAASLRATGLWHGTHHAVECWLSTTRPATPTGDAVVAALAAFGAPFLIRLLGEEHPLARLLADRLDGEALDRRIAAIVDRRLAALLARGTDQTP